MAKRFSEDDKILLKELHSDFGSGEFTVKQYCSDKPIDPRSMGGRFKGVQNKGGIERVKYTVSGNNARAWTYRISNEGMKVVR